MIKNSELIVYNISIPVWYDWQYQALRWQNQQHTISIPVWYDWQGDSKFSGCLTFYDFNSSMVRLTGGKICGFVCSLSKFQFQYGTIDRVLAGTSNSILALFQFQYGTIDRCLSRGKVRTTIIFQFQYGTIDSYRESSVYRGCHLFQFQYGTIDRGDN